MKTKNYLIILVTLFFYVSANSQETESIESLYSNYFKKTRELPFIHLNKTSLLKGENIWFQAYVLEQNSEKLHASTSNLYVSIYEPSGKLKEQHLVHIKDGIGKGNIMVDSSFTKKAYYLKASTKWMKNFDEDNGYSQKVIILKNKNDDNIDKAIAENEYFDFQLLPEGGHILANNHNKIGVIVKNKKNEGILITNGIIKNNKGEFIKFFRTNKFGFGSVILPFKETSQYFFEAVVENDITIKKETPMVQKIGIILNFNSENLVLNILTNPETLKNISNKKYKVMVHNTKRHVTYNYTFNERDVNYSLNFDENSIPEGINTITVFNEENKPILERLFYKESSKIISKKISTKIISSEADFLKLSIQNNSKERVFLSASFLPTETKAYKQDNNIVSTFLLKPYTKGHIENAQYYFNDKNSNRLADLDLLLITQGWSKYKWNTIFNKPTTDNYKFEKGIDITLTINTKMSPKKSLYISSNDNDYLAEVPFTGTGKYLIPNSYFKKKSIIKFAIKSDNDLFKIGPSLAFSANSLYENISFQNLQELKRITPEYTVLPFLSEDYIQLAEVIIKAENKELRDKQRYLNKNWRNRNSYRVTNNGMNSRRTSNSSAGANMPNPYGFLFFDGSTSSWENARFSGAQTFAWDSSVNTLGGFESMYGGGTNYSYYQEDTKEFGEVKLPVGFLAEKEYYAPEYPTFLNDSYKNHGAIFWKPFIIIEANSTLEFSIPKNYQKEIRGYFEGISENGRLVSKNVLIF